MYIITSGMRLVFQKKKKASTREFTSREHTEEFVQRHVNLHFIASNKESYLVAIITQNLARNMDTELSSPSP